jgi:glycine/D-amino acid oxidase-like deaminating enzyme
MADSQHDVEPHGGVLLSTAELRQWHLRSPPKQPPPDSRASSSIMADRDIKRTILIIGGGIIGSTTAYFLTRHRLYNAATTRIVLLEATQIAGGASGKAGGLLAKWAYPQPLVGLSFRLHRELADEHGGAERWGYRGLYCGEVEARGKVRPRKNGESGMGQSGDTSLQKRIGKEEKRRLERKGVPSELDWLDENAVRGYASMGDPTTTAQVHPEQFTTSMVDLAKEKGVEVVLGRAERIEWDSSSTSTETDKLGNSVDSPASHSVSYKTPSGSAETITANDVVIATGPWTSTLLPKAPIEPLRAHSVVIRPRGGSVSPHALFTSISLDSESASPEIYPRPDGTVYACGAGDTSVELPGTSADVIVANDRIEAIERQVGAISEVLAEGEVLKRQACYLPTVSGYVQGPFLGRLPGKSGAWLASGHTCWGIQNAPGTGSLMAEMIFEGKASVDVKRFDPGLVL